DTRQPQRGLDTGIDPRDAQTPRCFIHELPRGSGIETRRNDVRLQEPGWHVLDRIGNGDDFRSAASDAPDPSGLDAHFLLPDVGRADVLRYQVFLFVRVRIDERDLSHDRHARDVDYEMRSDVSAGS